jgi:hypothetical protein
MLELPDYKSKTFMLIDDESFMLDLVIAARPHKLKSSARSIGAHALTPDARAEFTRVERYIEGL